jgi:hypothetical protein
MRELGRVEESSLSDTSRWRSATRPSRDAPMPPVRRLLASDRCLRASEASARSAQRRKCEGSERKGESVRGASAKEKGVCEERGNRRV